MLVLTVLILSISGLLTGIAASPIRDRQRWSHNKNFNKWKWRPTGAGTAKGTMFMATSLGANSTSTAAAVTTTAPVFNGPDTPGTGDQPKSTKFVTQQITQVQPPALPPATPANLQPAEPTPIQPISAASGPAPAKGGLPTAGAIARTTSAKPGISAPPSTALASVSVPAPVPVPAPNPGGGGGGAGLCVDASSHAKASTFGKLGWYYTWKTSTESGMEGLEFVPMIKGIPEAQAFQPSVLGPAKYVLSFNEREFSLALPGTCPLVPSVAVSNPGAPLAGGEADPVADIPHEAGGTQMSEEDAAKYHNAWTAKAPAGVSIGSIAVARGKKAYWDKWKSICGANCRFDFIPIHFYGLKSSQFIEYAKSYQGEGKPLWVTELACREYQPDGKLIKCIAAETKAFMQEAIGWMRGEGAGLVQRWAWFGAFPAMAAEGDASGLIDAAGNANDMGKLYGTL